MYDNNVSDEKAVAFSILLFAVLRQKNNRLPFHANSCKGTVLSFSRKRIDAVFRKEDNQENDDEDESATEL